AEDGGSGLRGAWVGQVTLQGKEHFVTIRFTTEGGLIQSVLGFTLRGRMELKLKEGRLQSQLVRFVWDEPDGTAVCNGRVQEGVFVGQVQYAGLRSTLELVRVIDVDPIIYDQYIGLYEVPTGRVVSITRSPPVLC